MRSADRLGRPSICSSSSASWTTYTLTATLIGQEFRDDLSLKGSEFAKCFQDLERGTDAFAYVDPYLPIPSFKARDADARDWSS